MDAKGAQYGFMEARRVARGIIDQLLPVIGEERASANRRLLDTCPPGSFSPPKQLFRRWSMGWNDAVDN